MFKKIFLTLFILVLFNSCGYTPIYKGIVNANFNIILNEINGDRDIGNFIKSNLNRYETNSSDKEFNVSVSSNYQKNSISEDTTGKTTEYELKAVSIFKIEKNNNFKEIKIIETFNIKLKNLSLNTWHINYDQVKNIKNEKYNLIIPYNSDFNRNNF